MADRGRFTIHDEHGERWARVAGKVPGSFGPVVVARGYEFSEWEFARIAERVREMLAEPTLESVELYDGWTLRRA